MLTGKREKIVTRQCSCNLRIPYILHQHQLFAYSYQPSLIQEFPVEKNLELRVHRWEDTDITGQTFWKVFIFLKETRYIVLLGCCMWLQIEILIKIYTYPQTVKNTIMRITKLLKTFFYKKFIGCHSRSVKEPSGS